MAVAFNGQGGFGGNFYSAYKQVYNTRRVQILTFTNRPLMQALEFKDDFEGAVYAHTILYEDPQGGSANFQTAMSQALYSGSVNGTGTVTPAPSSQGARFMINRGREYQGIQMLNEEIEAARSDMGSLLRKKTRETNGLLNEMARRIDIALHGDGTGILASFTTGTSVATNVITLDTPQLGIRFSVGMFLQVATSRPSNGVIPVGFLLAPTAVQVVAVARGATQSTITLSAPLASLGAATSTQYFLLKNGDGLGFGQTNIYGGVAGLRSWLPLVEPVAGDSFWGYDRSVDTQRLSGTRYRASNGEKYESTFQNASAELQIQSSNPDSLALNPYDWNKYSQECGNKVRYGERSDAVTGLKTKGLIIEGQSGEIFAFSDPQVDPGMFYMLDMSTWWVKTLKAVPHLINSDGNTALRDTTNTNDAITMQWRAWYQPVCDAPGRNLVGTFAP